MKPSYISTIMLWVLMLLVWTLIIILMVHDFHPGDNLSKQPGFSVKNGVVTANGFVDGKSELIDGVLTTGGTKVDTSSIVSTEGIFFTNTVKKLVVTDTMQVLNGNTIVAGSSVLTASDTDGNVKWSTFSSTGDVTSTKTLHDSGHLMVSYNTDGTSIGNSFYQSEQGLFPSIEDGPKLVGIEKYALHNFEISSEQDDKQTGMFFHQKAEGISEPLVRISGLLNPDENVVDHPTLINPLSIRIGRASPLSPVWGGVSATVSSSVSLLGNASTILAPYETYLHTPLTLPPETLVSVGDIVEYNADGSLWGLGNLTPLVGNLTGNLYIEFKTALASVSIQVSNDIDLATGVGNATNTWHLKVKLAALNATEVYVTTYLVTYGETQLVLSMKQTIPDYSSSDLQIRPMIIFSEDPQMANIVTQQYSSLKFHANGSPTVV
jgi:hypothetical protein